MNLNLLKRYFLLAIMVGAMAAVPVACSSDDGPDEPEMPDTEEPTDPEPVDPVATPDPTNENTTVEATAAELIDGTSTSTVTVTLADSDGNKLTGSGGTITLSGTGSAVISDVTDNGDGTYTATVTNTREENVVITASLGDTAITDEATITFNPDNSNPAQDTPQSTVEAGPSLLRINSGGPEVTVGDITFLADQYFQEENTVAYVNPFVTEIEGTELDTIYQSERITADGTNISGPFSYNIPVSNGIYSVKLYFAEIYWGVQNPQGFEGDVGRRIFNISMEDQEIFTGYDLVKEVGPATASFRMYDIEVTDGELNITFEATVNKPKISALEIFGNGTIGGTTAP